MAIFGCLIAELVKAALENFKIPGLSAMFDGSALNIGGLIADSDRDKVIGSLKGSFGSGLSLGTLTEDVNAKALAALNALKPGFGPNDEEQTMSIFGNIMSSIFGKANAAGAAPAAPASGAKPSSSTPAAAPAGSITEVDVAGVLTKLASEKKEKLDWRTSIVDLMKLLDLDSSLSARKELAQELHYSGDMNDSASMNVWLHKQVMRKLAENGGKVPEELRA